MGGLVDQVAGQDLGMGGAVGEDGARKAGEGPTAEGLVESATVEQADDGGVLGEQGPEAVLGRGGGGRQTESSPGASRAPTIRAVGLRCGHSASGCSSTSVALNGAQGPVPTRALVRLPISQAREPKAMAAPRTQNRR